MDAILRIAGNDYEVRRVTPQAALGSEFIGEISYKNLTITIDATQPDWSQRKILLHELIHASDKYNGSGDNHLSEEQVVAVENALWSIFRDNPGLAAAIFEGTA